MGSGASARLEEAAKADPGDFKPALAWKETVLDSIVVLGDYAIMGATALGYEAMEMAVPFLDKGDKKLVCIVDCGQADLYFSKFWGLGGGCLDGQKIDTWIILMPSIDSDPSCYGSSFMQSMLVASAACSGAGENPETADIRFVHRDFYFANPIGSGFEWLPAFLDKDAKILPGSQKDSMKAWYDSWDDKVWGTRAGVFHVCMAGMDEMDIREGREVVSKLLSESKVADDSDYQAPSSILTLAITPEGDKMQVACSKISGDALFSKAFKENDTIGELDAFLREEFPDSGPPTFLHESSTVSVDSKIASYKELTVKRPLVGKRFPDLVQFPQGSVRLTVGGCHGLAKEFSLEEFEFDDAKVAEWREAKADIYFFADVASLTKEFDQGIVKLKESLPRNILTLVMIAKEFESFKQPNFACRLDTTVENTDMCVLATLDDIEKVKAVFLPKLPAYSNAQRVYQAMVPYPRLKYLSLLGEDGKTCGKDVPDRCLLFTSLKCGTGAPTLPIQKFGERQCIVGPDGPLHFLTAPGEDKATLVQPGKILLDIFKIALQADCTEGDDFARSEVVSNVRAIRSDYKQFLDAGDASDEAEEEVPAPFVPPDGSLESAAKCLQNSRRDLKEVKCFGRPPPDIILPLKAAAVLLNVEINAANEWKDCQRMLGDGDFVHKILDITTDSITTEQWTQVRTLVAANDALFTYESQARKSRFSAVLTAWIMAFMSSSP